MAASEREIDNAHSKIGEMKSFVIDVRSSRSMSWLTD
jgi:hypothetical protein